MIYIMGLIILLLLFYIWKLKSGILHVNDEENQSEDEYFKSDRDRIVFLLLEVDGERRNALLGITDEMYENKKLAKKWYKKTALIVHPDKKNGNIDAFNELKELYLVMTDSDEVDCD